MKVTRLRRLRRGLDVADAALTHVGKGAPMRIIARAGGATLGRPRLTDPVHRGIGAAGDRALVKQPAALATSLRSRLALARLDPPGGPA